MTSDWSLFGGQLDTLDTVVAADNTTGFTDRQCQLRLDICEPSLCASELSVPAMQRLDDDDRSLVMSSSNYGCLVKGLGCDTLSVMEDLDLMSQQPEFAHLCNSCDDCNVDQTLSTSTGSTAESLEDLDCVGGYVTSIFIDAERAATNVDLCVEEDDFEIVDNVEVECETPVDESMAADGTQSAPPSVCAEPTDLVVETDAYSLMSEDATSVTNTICTDVLDQLLLSWPPDLCDTNSNLSDFHASETVNSCTNSSPPLSIISDDELEHCFPDAHGCLRRLRKKEQNKTAASRYRQRKRSEQGLVLSEYSWLERRNAELKKKLEEMTHEICYLKGLIDELCPR